MYLELCYLSACEGMSRVRDGSLSPVEMIRALIERSEALNPKLNAFTEILAKSALAAVEMAAARYGGKGEPPRPLEGVPTGIQLVGPAYDDVRVFRTVADYERVRPWMDKPENRPAIQTGVPHLERASR